MSVFTGLGRAVVLVHDAEEAQAFYRDVLGFEVLYDEVNDGFRLLHVGVPGQRGVGLWLIPARAQARERVGNQTDGEPLLVLYTDDIEAVRRHLDRHKVKILTERVDPGSRSVHFADLYGNEIVAAQLTG